MKTGYIWPYKGSKNKQEVSARQEYRFFAQFDELVKFGIVGVSNTVIFWGISTFVTYLFYEKYERSYIIGNILAFLVSVAWSFFWNKCLVFMDKSRGWDLVIMLYKSYITYSFTGILLNNFLSWIWIEKMGLIYTVVPLLNSVVGFPINFFFSKRWTFVKESE